MKSSRYVLFIAVSLILTVSVTLADVGRWTSTGPPGVNVWSLAIDPVNPDRIYAGTAQEVFVTSDGGVTWVSLPSSPSASELVIDPLSPATTYAFSQNGLFKTTDAGHSWTTLAPTPGGFPDILALDPLNPSTIVGATDGGVYRSTDGGGSWSGRSLASRVYNLVFSSQTPSVLWASDFEGGFYYPERSKLFKSTDQGASWIGGVVTPIGISWGTLTIHPTNPSTLYAVNELPSVPTGVYRSVDSGANWTRTSVLWNLGQVTDLAIDPRTPSTLYVATFNGVFRSTDGGANWTDWNTGLSNRSVRSLAIDCTGTRLYAITWEGGAFAYQTEATPNGVSCRAEGYSYRTLPPCRLADTRGPTGTLGGPALQAQGIREFPVGGYCGVPASAKAVFANLTATDTVLDGSLTAYPANLLAAPLATSVAYTAGKTRATASTIPLSPTGAMRVRCSQASGTVHLIVDIQGYFE